MSTMRDHYLDTLVSRPLGSDWHESGRRVGGLIEVIDAELVACTLGQRDHAELQVRS
jgi:hypothetical protein